ncbi:unannotated protein [freshwater metagenome]|uniref:Unannotated protein n=1 Tax=freshwater metagenome TaxID=449393 RepID=A0A6J7XX88_9ZZZZ|nr:hypothetical protein [Actinomycetota bacterium]
MKIKLALGVFILASGLVAGVVPANAAAPVNSVAPVLSGTNSVGSVLTVTSGTWVAVTPSYSYQWQRCTTNTETPTGCSVISTTNPNTYTLTSFDVNKYIRVSVTALDTNGGTTVFSNFSALVGAAPSNTSLPVISGITTPGSTLTATTGSWRAPISSTFEYSWLSCTSSTLQNLCSPIGGAVTNSFVLSAPYLGKYIRVSVTAKDTTLQFSTTVTSAATSVITIPATLVSAPTLSGTAFSGSVLRVTNGTWSAAISTFFYQWQRCTTNTISAVCSAITGATQNSYTATSTDVNKYLRVSVTALNVVGGTTVFSNFSGLIANVPVNISLPTITGQVVIGSTVSATTGTWSAPVAGVYSYLYAWSRCTTQDVGSCTTISQASQSTYAITAIDAGKYIRVAVTAVDPNPIYRTTVSSAPTALISGPPTNSVAPTITGEFFTTKTLTSNSGTWISTPAPTLALQWQVCTSVVLSTCVSIPGAITSTYVVQATDQDKYLRLQVSASNYIGGTFVYSALTPVIRKYVPLINTVAPKIIGTPQDGVTLSVDKGLWGDSANVTYTYKWQRCTTDLTCIDIPLATLATYKVVTLDIGTSLKVLVSANNTFGSTVVPTASVKVEPLFKNLKRVSITKITAKVGGKALADAGLWVLPALNPSVTYVWQRCTTRAGATCVTIAKATKLSYTLSKLDRGKYIRFGAVPATATKWSYSPISVKIK